MVDHGERAGHRQRPGPVNGDDRARGRSSTAPGRRRRRWGSGARRRTGAAPVTLSGPSVRSSPAPMMDVVVVLMTIPLPVSSVSVTTTAAAVSAASSALNALSGPGRRGGELGKRPPPAPPPGSGGCTGVPSSASRTLFGGRAPATAGWPPRRGPAARSRRRPSSSVTVERGDRHDARRRRTSGHGPCGRPSGRRPAARAADTAVIRSPGAEDRLDARGVVPGLAVERVQGRGAARCRRRRVTWTTASSAAIATAMSDGWVAMQELAGGEQRQVPVGAARSPRTRPDRNRRRACCRAWW